MILTPTYHVFNMYKTHQDAELIDSYIETKEIGLEKENMVPNLYESVSLDANGKVTVTITNLSISEDYDIEGIFTDSSIKAAHGTILTNHMKAHNTFESPNVVNTKDFNDYTITDKGLDFKIPACSVLKFELELN